MMLSHRDLCENPMEMLRLLANEVLAVMLQIAFRDFITDRRQVKQGAGDVVDVQHSAQPCVHYARLGRIKRQASGLSPWIVDDTRG